MDAVAQIKKGDTLQRWESDETGDGERRRALYRRVAPCQPLRYANAWDQSHALPTAIGGTADENLRYKREDCEKPEVASIVAVRAKKTDG